MRLIPILLVAAPAAAAPPPCIPPGSSSLGVAVTQLNVTVGKGVKLEILDDTLAVVSDVALRCYAQAQAQQPELTGTLALRFRIDPKGTATDVAVTGVPSVSACLTEAIQGATFSSSRLGTIELREDLSLQNLVAMARVDGVLTSDNLVSRTAGCASDTEVIPKITIGQPNVQGALERATVRDALKHEAPQLEACYDKQLRATPGLAGTVIAAFTIGANGKVSSASASGKPGDAVGACFTAVIKRIAFPRPKTGEVGVNAPFILHPPAHKP